MAEAELSRRLGEDSGPVSMDEASDSPVARTEAVSYALAEEAAEGLHTISLKLFKDESNGDIGQENRDSNLVVMKGLEDYLHECSKQGLGMDAQLLREAVDLFRKVRSPLLTNLDATEGGRILERMWGACVLYVAKKLRVAPSGGGSNSSCFTLSQLLQVTRVSVVDFFKELAQFSLKVGPALKSIFGDDFEKRLLIPESQTNFGHLVVLFNYYKRVYQDYFLAVEIPALLRPGSNFSIHMEFGWMLFSVLRMRVLPQFSDLVTCTNGLLAVIAIMILHMPASLRRNSLEDTTKFGVRTAGGVDVVASLCQLYHASDKDVAGMVKKTCAMLQDVFQKNSLTMTAGVQGSGLDTEGFSYFEGLMDDATILHNLDVIESDYESAYISQGELDERTFIRDDGTLIGAASLSVSGIKRKFDVMSSPHGAGGSAVQSPLGNMNSPCSSPLKSEPVAIAANKMPPPTPVSTTMTTAKWFRTVIAPLPSEPSAELKQAFRSCDHDVSNDIRCRLHALMGAIFPSNGTGSWRVLGGARGTALMDSIWAEQRSLEATKLYYKVLSAMCRSEGRRQPANNLTALLTNDKFHRCMIACSAELVLATHKTVTMTFPAVLGSTGITAFDLSKVIEGFVRYEETLPRELKRHLNSLEERLLESMAWERGSSMYDALLVAKPNLSAEISRSCLLPDPVPPLDLKSLGPSWGIPGIVSTENEAGAIPCVPGSPPRPTVPSAGKSGSNITGLVEVPVVPGLRSPSVERASAFSAFSSPLKGRMQPSLHSQFASPQRPGPLGGGETCAEIVISVFFQKVLKLAANRIRNLCERLQLSIQIMEHVYSILRQMLHNGTTVFFHRHIDQLILCSIYGVCKVSRVNVTFRDIIFHYRKQPQCKPHVFRNVFIDFPSMRRMGKAGAQETGDIIRFYNEVFVPTAKVFLLQISANGTCSLSASGYVDSSNKSDGKPSEVSEPSTFPALPDMSPKKVSATHNVYVSPLRAMKMDFIMSPHTRSLYACVGESTHEYQSPSKDLSAINNRLNSSRRLDFSEPPAARERETPNAAVAAGVEECYPSTSPPTGPSSYQLAVINGNEPPTEAIEVTFEHCCTRDATADGGSFYPEYLRQTRLPVMRIPPELPLYWYRLLWYYWCPSSSPIFTTVRWLGSSASSRNGCPLKSDMQAFWIRLPRHVWWVVVRAFVLLCHTLFGVTWQQLSCPMSQSNEEPGNLWTPPKTEGWRSCISSSDTHAASGNTVGYLQVFLEGGLNQQRMGICDAVAVAVLLNATLVLPHFDLNPYWKDPSSFADIFDVDHFIRSLSGVVDIVEQLPESYRWSTREYYATGIRPTRVKTAPSLASPDWYTTNVLPILHSYGIVAIAPFSHRLAFDDIPDEVQKLRCRVNFEALKFVPAINTLGDTIVQRLHHIGDITGVSVINKDAVLPDNLWRAQSFKYVVLHLRFDKDMAAHSACDFGGGKAEKLALAKYRQIFWQGRVKKTLFSADHLRQQGKCPLTPEEIGIALGALGFSNHTRIYLASHKVYGGEARMSALLQLFPLLLDKTSLSTEEELRPFQGKASLLAALDYYVALHSDVFISASPGNMHNALVGHRTFENVQKTIRPDMKLLAELFANATISWADFSQAVVEGHKHRVGQVRARQRNQSLYTYPAPDCMCR